MGESRLSLLTAGDRAQLTRFDVSAHDESLLNALGLVVGHIVCVRKVGDPCIIEVGATRIAVSRVVADGLWMAIDRGETTG